ncbi:Ig-like domain-containing protein [Streptosporangium sp. DT93]|uniref:Ig-like domain-containing protein n=1 Tax=Streptosporangium sp. DT93 TaxID=3393428 RepID=UPI003CED4BC7
MLKWKVYAVPPDGVRPVHVPTLADTLPALPATVTATFNDGSKDSSVAVTWDAVDPASYAAPGTFTVDGRVTGTTVTARAVVTVT